MCKFTTILIILSILLVSMGGIKDIFKKDLIRINGYSPSREHYWSDGLYLLLLAAVLRHFFRI